MKILMLGLMMVFAVTSVTAVDEISVTRDRVEKKIKAKKDVRFIFVTNKIDRTWSVTGKIANHYVRNVKQKYGGGYFQISADGTVKTSEQNLKEPVLVCYILLSNKKTGRKLVRTAAQNQYKEWQDGDGAVLNPKEASKKKVEVPASQWRAFRCLTPSNGPYIYMNSEEEIHCYRMELWQDGKLLDVKDTSKLSILRKLDLDFEWYVDGKNKEKLSDYR